MVGRGLGRSGFNNSAQSRLGREALQQASNLRSNIGMQQALGELDLGKFQAGQDLQRQGMQAGEGQFGAGLGQWLQNAQAGENLARSGMDLQRQGLQSQNNLSQASQSLQAMLGLSGLQQQQFGTYGTLLNQQNQQALQPYQMLAGLYSPALSQSFSSGGKGDPFTALMQGAGPIMTGAKAVCLPKGTQIEVEGGAMPVEELRLGDFVKGGEVIAIGSRKRHQGHSFYRHDFQNGSVIMSDGHPFFDELIKKEIVEHDSENTYDILTSEGHYFVNGVKLGSTLR
jgi:hypothetical protein